MSDDPVSHPKHYTSHPSGVECIQITEHMGFNLGNAVKYIWRADLKADAIQDLEKARWYLDREIAKRKAAASPVVKLVPAPVQLRRPRLAEYVKRRGKTKRKAPGERQ